MLKRTLSLTFLLLSCCSLLLQAQASAPEDISGMYSFLRDGEFLQVNVGDDHHVSGYISRYGDGASDKGQFLDQFFESGSLDGNRLAFKSKYVHGVAYEFKGTVERGKNDDRNLEGYFLLKGTLTEYRKDADEKPVAKSRTVEFKSFPAELSGR